MMSTSDQNGVELKHYIIFFWRTWSQSKIKTVRYKTEKYILNICVKPSNNHKITPTAKSTWDWPHFLSLSTPLCHFSVDLDQREKQI